MVEIVRALQKRKRDGGVRSPVARIESPRGYEILGKWGCWTRKQFGVRKHLVETSFGDVGAVQRAQGETRYLRSPNLRSFSALLKYDTGFSPRLEVDILQAVMHWPSSAFVASGHGFCCTKIREMRLHEDHRRKCPAMFDCHRHMPIPAQYYCVILGIYDGVSSFSRRQPQGLTSDERATLVWGSERITPRLFRPFGLMVYTKICLTSGGLKMNQAESSETSQIPCDHDEALLPTRGSVLHPTPDSSLPSPVGGIILLSYATEDIF